MRAIAGRIKKLRAESAKRRAQKKNLMFLERWERGLQDEISKLKAEMRKPVVTAQRRIQLSHDLTGKEEELRGVRRKIVKMVNP
jgi:hypothetical protein